MNATCFSFALTLSAPARAAAPGHCPYIALGDLVPPSLLRRCPYFRFPAVLALERSINVEPSFDKIRYAVATRRTQPSRVYQDLASQKLLLLNRLFPRACKTLFHRLLRAFRGSALQDSGPAWAIASHERYRMNSAALLALAASALIAVPPFQTWPPRGRGGRGGWAAGYSWPFRAVRPPTTPP